MKENKNHWYDGLFYEKIIAPNQDRIFGQIKNHIRPNSKIIDIGCGTGRFSFSLNNEYKSILGIDLSKRNIDRANLLLSKKPKVNISFQHKSVTEIISDGKDYFDYAVLTYVIHEVNEEDRIKLLKEVSQVADKIIIGDYLVPQPNGFWKWLNEIVEFAAGNEHYRNYKNFIFNGGIQELADKAELKILTEIRDRPLTSHLVILSSK